MRPPLDSFHTFGTWCKLETFLTFPSISFRTAPYRSLDLKEAMAHVHMCFICKERVALWAIPTSHSKYREYKLMWKVFEEGSNDVAHDFIRKIHQKTGVERCTSREIVAPVFRKQEAPVETIVAGQVYRQRTWKRFTLNR